MLESSLAEDNLTTAKNLLSEGMRDGRGTDFRRAVSTADYAVFHALAKSSADCLIGAVPSKRPNKAWIEVYRGLNHASCLKACLKAHEVGFPVAIHEFADAFVQLQKARHSADYDPTTTLDDKQVRVLISLAETCIARFRRCRVIDRRAFAAWVLITSRGAEEARKKLRGAR